MYPQILLRLMFTATAITCRLSRRIFSYANDFNGKKAITVPVDTYELTMKIIFLMMSLINGTKGLHYREKEFSVALMEEAALDPIFVHAATAILGLIAKHHYVDTNKRMAVLLGV
jgi:hypothetical protein